MKLIKTLSLLIAIFVLSTTAACASRSGEAINSGASNDSLQNSPASQPTPASQATTKTNQSAQTTDTKKESQKPVTKIDTISIEGEKTKVTLKLFDRANEIFTTYFPDKDFVAESGGSGEGTGARFYYNVGGHQNKDVYVAMFFPAKATTLERMRQLVGQEHGMFPTNRWQVVNRTKEVPYSWAKEKIVYRQHTGSQNLGGEVYIGEANGKAFYVITHYPAEYGDGFSPRADLILKNLQVNG